MEGQISPPLMQGFESRLGESMVHNERSRSSMERALATEESKELQRLISKDNPSSEDFSKLIFCLSSIELKLCNLGLQQQYILLKYFVWVREYVRVAQKFYELDDKFNEVVKDQKGKPLLDADGKQQYVLKNDERPAEQYLNVFRQSKRNMLHNTKYMIDLFVAMMRSTLSIGATGFLEVLKIKHEVAYHAPLAGVANGGQANV